MAKTLEQVESWEDLKLLVRGDRVKLVDVDFRGRPGEVYDVAVLSNEYNVIEFIMPHPDHPNDTIRKYITRVENVTFADGVFCVHEGHVGIDNLVIEPIIHNYWTKNRERIETLKMAGFEI